MAFAFCLRLFVVETVVAPLVGVAERTRKEGSEVVVVIFSLTKHTTLVHVSVVVAAHNVAHRELLVFEERISRSTVVGSLHIRAKSIDVVCTIEEVGDAVIVRSHIRTEVKTSIHIEALAQLLGESRHEAIPTVLVVAHGHHHL